MPKHRIKRDRARRESNGLTQAQRADRYVLYENSVQCVEAEIDFVDAEFERLTGRKARYLREDFCGTANTSCEWVKRRSDSYAVGVDLEPQVLAWGREHHLAELSSSQRERILLIESDVRDVATVPQDMALAMNFSYWVFKERALLRGYFSTVHAALASDGVFFLDCFGGYDTQRVMKEHTEHDDYTYTWDQARFNPVDSNMTCHIHFRFDDGSRLKEAFSYDWRLWTLAELREILLQAGFTQTLVYWQGWDEHEEDGNGEFTVVQSADADAGWICYLSATK